MAKKKSYLTITDQFCGAGGSSQGARRVSEKLKGGLEIKLALNHWKLAIETHNTNFPDTLHDCTDVSACDPRRYFSTDILITSPECTNHSLAKGQKQVKAQIDLFDKGKLDPAAERSRATMWDVPRFAEYHNYNIIIVENVVDARKWVMWDAWTMAMDSLGYNHECVYLNSMFCHPTPQSRDRLYVVFWKKKNKKPNLDYRPLAYCPSCNNNVEAFQSWKNNKFKWGRYGERNQYLYRCPECLTAVTPYYFASFNIIDWSDLGTRIGDRKKPLSDNTIKRIQFGLDKYGNDPLLVTGRYTSGIECRIRNVKSEAMPTQPGDGSHYLFNPAFLLKNYGGGFNDKLAPVDIKKTIGTITTADHHALLSMPFVIQGDHAQCDPSGKVKSVNNPMQTQTTRQSMGICVPFIIENNRTGKARETKEALSTILAGGNHHALLTPFIVENKGLSKSRNINEHLSTITTKSYHGLITSEAFKSFLAYNYNGLQISHITEPTDTIPTVDRLSLINYEVPKIEDCFYRMLKPHEVKLGMAFDEDYQVLGNSRDQVKQCGNAVTPPAMEFLIERCIESLK